LESELETAFFKIEKGVTILPKSTFVTRFLVPLLTELAQKIKQLVKL
jgi:hypothetical protein